MLGETYALGKVIGYSALASSAGLVGNLALPSLIREGKTSQIASFIQSGAAEGMQTIDAALDRLVREGAARAHTTRSRRPSTMSPSPSSPTSPASRCRSAFRQHGRRVCSGMAQTEEHVLELLKLPREKRAHAAQMLLDSLDEDPADLEAEALCAAELTRRARAVADGSAERIGADEVRRRVNARLREARTK
jgi:putative addiction module component (TIGR02574 family)